MPIPLPLAAPSPDPSLATLDLDAEIRRLKRDRNAVLLAHYYQESEIQDLGDFIGDSLQLAQEAKRTNADVILFAGVHFMAETAKILNPDRIVIVPDLGAGCSLADGCPVEPFRAWKAQHPGSVVVSYINCSAEVKAESDYICTSSNAKRIVESIPADREVLFAPDRNLGRWIEREIGRKLVLWPGSCQVHETFSLRKLLELRARHPGAKVIAHPECEEAVLDHADFIGSTSALLRYAAQDSARELIVATEEGILHQMRKAAPEKVFIAAPPDGTCACNQCPYMRLNTPEKVYLALRDLQPRLELDEALRRRAQVPIDRMLALS
ncbi:MAG: quinolinate synthase NadA [Polyangiaceae bacterium]|nr:quinolinate synthase NadA [Polyangiaceae bacterium]